MKKSLTLLLIILPFVSFTQTIEEVKMLNLINQIRTSPRSFIPMLDSLKNKELEYENQNNTMSLVDELKKKISENIMVSFKTSQSEKFEKRNIIRDIDETISFLDTVSPVSPLKFDTTMYNTMKNHNFKQNEKNDSIKHIDNSQTDHLSWGENISTSDEVIDTMLQFIIDSNNDNKGHRKNIFNEKWNIVAVVQVDNCQNIKFVQNFAQLR